LLIILNTAHKYIQTIIVEKNKPHINAIANQAHNSSFKAKVVNQITVVNVVKKIGFTLELIVSYNKFNENFLSLFILSLYDSISNIDVFTQTHISQKIHI
jgi:hypothetical protein